MIDAGLPALPGGIVQMSRNWYRKTITIKHSTFRQPSLTLYSMDRARRKTGAFRARV